MKICKMLNLTLDSLFMCVLLIFLWFSKLQGCFFKFVKGVCMNEDPPPPHYSVVGCLQKFTCCTQPHVLQTRQLDYLRVTYVVIYMYNTQLPGG